MPGTKRPTDQDAATARHALLDGLARDAGILEVLSELAPLHPRNDTFPGEVFLHSPRTRWNGAGPAGPSRCPWRGCASATCPSAPSADGRTPSSSTRSWPRRPSTAGPNRTCSRTSPTGRLMTSGSTPCTRRSPTSAPLPVGQASQSVRHASISASTPATRLYPCRFGTARTDWIGPSSCVQNYQCCAPCSSDWEPSSRQLRTFTLGTALHKYKVEPSGPGCSLGGQRPEAAG